MPSRTLPFRPDRPCVAEVAAGAVLLGPVEAGVLLLHERREDRWCLPKGHVDPGESARAAAEREVLEETGLSDVDWGPEVETIHYRFYDPARGASVVKSVIYYLARSRGREVRPEPTTFDAAAWMPLDRARAQVAYEEERRVLASAGALAGTAAGSEGIRNRAPAASERERS